MNYGIRGELVDRGYYYKAGIEKQITGDQQSDNARSSIIPISNSSLGTFLRFCGYEILSFGLGVRTESSGFQPSNNIRIR